MDEHTPQRAHREEGRPGPEELLRRYGLQDHVRARSPRAPVLPASLSSSLAPASADLEEQLEQEPGKPLVAAVDCVSTWLLRPVRAKHMPC